MAQRKRRTKAQVEADKARANKPEPKGLGDTIENITKATGLDKVAKFLMGEDCGCDERKDKLNKLFPYAKPLCLNEQEYEYLHGYYESKPASITISQQQNILAIYNRVLRQDKQPTSCSSCYREIHNELKKIYDEY